MSLSTAALWTLDGARLQRQFTSNRSTNSIHFNWVFAPGGPGLGSEALAGLTEALADKIPGTIWHLDLPNDGSNLLADKPIANWRSALTQAVSALDNVVLVAHSTLGMYAQTMPELETILRGLVLMASAPNASWQVQFEKYCAEINDPAISTAAENYGKTPNNETLRQLLLAAAGNSFVTETSLATGRQLLSTLPVNHHANAQNEVVFDNVGYKANWVPAKINAMILGGSVDHITPLHLFCDNADYRRDNILIREIVGAGHYPWIERPTEVVQAFQTFAERLNGKN